MLQVVKLIKEDWPIVSKQLKAKEVNLYALLCVP